MWPPTSSAASNLPTTSQCIQKTHNLTQPFSGTSAIPCDIPLPPPPPSLTAASTNSSKSHSRSDSPFQLPPPPPPLPPPTTAPPSVPTSVVIFDSTAASSPGGITSLPPAMPPPPPPLPSSDVLAAVVTMSEELSLMPATPPAMPLLSTSYSPNNTTANTDSHQSTPGTTCSTVDTTIAGVSPGSNSTSSSIPHSRETTLCRACGYVHEVNGSHVYVYHKSADANLLCQICRLPLIDPLDTKCGHTFCTPCLKNHLAVQALCPVDKKIINYLECQQASNIVKRLLDKLLVVCPNVDYCEDVLPRSDLESHLKYWCRGAITPCPNANQGCTFQGPRIDQATHKLECRYRDQNDDDCGAVGGQPVTNGSSQASSTSGRSNRGAGTNTSSPEIPFPSEKPPVLEGDVSMIQIVRHGHCDLGISIVGGCDTPLMCIIIQEIYLDGLVTKDGRLRPGDQILEVNGEDLTNASHHEAKQALSTLTTVCKLTIYREKAEESVPVEKEEIIQVVLSKRNDKKLGIKLVGKKNRPGLYILGLVKNAEADKDGRLKKDDRILEINGINLREGTQDNAAEIITGATDKVKFVVARQTRPQTPDIIRTASGENITDCANPAMDGAASGGLPVANSMVRKGSLNRVIANFQKVVTINKAPNDSLGMSVAGGLNSQRGDTPIYVTNVTPEGALGRNRQVRKGDILLAVNDKELLRLSHEQAVEALKSASIDSRQVVLRTLDGPETCSGGGNFMPSWVYWLQLPRFVQISKLIVLPRAPNGSLGFSIVGGNDCLFKNSVTPSLTAAGLPQPIVVKSIVPGTPAFMDGRLKCGDILVSVNNLSLMDIAHAHAVTILKHVRGDVHLQVVSWPGTIV